MFRRLGAAAARRPLLIVLVWLVLAATWLAISVVGVTGQGLFDRLHSGEPTVPGSESLAGSQIVDDAATSGESITLALTDIDMTDGEALAQVQRSLNAFRPNAQGVEGVLSVMDPFQVPGGLEDPAAAALLSTEGDGFVVTVTLEPDLAEQTEADAREQVVDLLRELPADIGGDTAGLVSGSHLITEEIVGQLERDLQRGELVALPLSLLIMVVVFGGFLAAGIPIFGAVASIAGGLGALYAFSFWLDLDSAVVNVVTVMALGLSIDYGLLIVSRYREEIRAAMAQAEAAPTRRSRSTHRRGKDELVRTALIRTMSTAGRTVAFSGLTVAICVAGLMVMRADILRAVGAAGLSVVLIAVTTAMSLVPALIALFGRRLTRPGLLSRIPGIRAVIARLGDVAPEHGFFSRLATHTQKRPWIVVLVSTALLVLMASPLAGVHLRNSTIELVPEGSDQRTFLTLVQDSYPALAAPPVSVVVEAASAVEVAEAIAAVENVTGIDPPQEVDERYSVLGVRLATEDAGGPTATEAVSAIRDLRDAAGADLGEYWVIGQAASQLDFVDSMVEGAPYAAALVVLAIFVLLFLMTGSLLIPLKALLVNTLSLAAGLGVTAWVFAEGHLEDVLGFTSTGGLESYVVAMAAAFGFGLAMDYEVFLLARIKEQWDAGEDNDTAVRNGLQRTGRIITSAGLVMIVVFGGFMTGEMLIIKQVGFALAFTVLLDATLVRMLLVPATMTMLGRANWWAPGPLRRLHRRFGIDH
ncbi:MMPL family transporter [Pseudactinotalea suaedae]|uniref:MMPL family transporter n=1 Tax=Pseudactinotalea suaedae TaxID=1524924 RepID=UPI001F50235D|nr:MMPL family transporter [Pseudactinotalea suaedae]